MKIDKTNKPLPVTPAGSQQNGPVNGRTAAKTGSGQAATSGAGADVHISSTAAQLQNLGADTPVVDAAKVERIRQAISSGYFQVNSGVVADRLIQTATELVQSAARRA